MADSDQIPSLEVFATRFGVTITRVHQIEISARRKIAVALAASGYADVTGDDVVAHLSQIRARRAAGRTAFAAPGPEFRPASGPFGLVVAAN